MKMYHSILLSALVLLSAAASCKEKHEPTPEPEPEVNAATFTATLDASAATPFKTSWTDGDAIHLIGVKDGHSTSETITASSVSSASATFTSKGSIKEDCDEYYAFIAETGVSGCDPASSWTVSSSTSSTRSIAVAKCGKGSSTLSFRNIFSFLKVEVSDASVKSIELKGNNEEDLNYDVTVSTSDYSVSLASKPTFEAQKVIKVNVGGSGDCYISLVPGTVLGQGYTVTAYDASGKVVSKSVYSDKLTVPNGKVMAAGELQPESVEFTASFEDTTTPEFKSTWTDGDVIEVACLDGETLVTETIKATDISSDGRTAKFVSNGTLPAGASGYYAMIPGTGIDGCQKANWSTSNLDGNTIEKPTVTVASCADGSGTLAFKNIFSLLAFKVDEPASSYVVLEGNNSERISKNMLVSFSSQNVNGNTTPAFESTTSLKKTIEPDKTYWFGLYPGLKLSKGYTLRVYNSAGKEIGYSKNNSSLTVEKGKIYNAAKFVITKPTDKTKNFDASNIVLSLGVVSDVHVNQQAQANKWKSALQQFKAKALENDSNGMAGVLVVGDLIDQPSNNQLSLFRSTLESEIDVKKTPMIYTIGNHDVPRYAWASTMVSDVAYMRNMFGNDYFQTDQDQEMRTKYEARHCVIGDYHILCVSPNGDQPIVYDPTVVTWLDNQLAAITSAEPEKYVIVITHPMIKNTVYGSRLGEEGGIWESTLSHYWATDALTPVLRKYPQAIVFGGHLHFPLNDPRSVWQGDFSVFGCASVRYMALENGKYEDMSSATVMKDCNDFSQGNLLQFDASGNMRVLRMDFYNKDVIGEPIVSSYPTSDKGHLTKYNHTTLSLANAAPSLSTLNVDVTDGIATAKWAAGTDDEFVHHYVLTLKKGGAVVTTMKILADFYKSAKTSGMRREWTRSLGNVTDGTYELTLEAFDSWDAAAKPLKKTFQVGSTSNSLWTNDEAGSKSVSGGSGNASEDWLTYSNGTLSWTANTTGKPRTATITLPDGTAYSVTQISVEDFKGEYSLTSKMFNNEGSKAVATDKKVIDVTIGGALKGETLKDGTGASHTNNLGIDGLYHKGLIAEAAVEIDYEAKSVRFGVFTDARKAQKDPSPVDASAPYVAFLPEMCKTWTPGSFKAPWYFNTPDLGDPDYEWIWFDVNSSFTTFSYTPAKAQTLSTSNPKGYGPYIIGISVVSFKAEDVTAANSKFGSNLTGYNYVYQFNVDNGNIGVVFNRK